MSFNISNPSCLGKRQSWFDRFRAWRVARAAEAELFALSDRDLKDIGLARYDIRTAVRGAVRR